MLDDSGRRQNAAGHKLEPRSFAPSITRPGIEVIGDEFGQWPVTASHPAKDYKVAMEVRPWSVPTPAPKS